MEIDKMKGFESKVEVLQKRIVEVENEMFQIK